LYKTEAIISGSTGGNSKKASSSAPKKPEPYRSIFARDVGWSIVDCHYNQEQELVAYSSWSPYVYLYNCKNQDGEVKKQAVHQALDLQPQQMRFCAFSVRFAPDGKELLAGTSDFCLYLYDLVANKRVMRIVAHEDDVNTISYASDDNSNIFISSGDDSYIKVWDKRCYMNNQMKHVGMLVGHQDGVTFIDSKGDGNYFVTNGKDQCMKIWDLRKMKDISKDSLSRNRASHRSYDYRYQHCPSRMTKSVNPDDMSLMSYSGHRVLQTLVRCYFSPASTTGQRYLYTGSQDGCVYSKYKRAKSANITVFNAILVTTLK